MELTGKSFEGIIDSLLGFYDIAPAFVKEGEEVIDQIEYHNGYFQGHLDFIERYYNMLDCIKEIGSEGLVKLLELEVGWFHMKSKKFLLNMNDMFAWACADCEEVDEKDYKEVLRLYGKYGHDGLIYWVAEKRGYDPDGTDSEGHAEIEKKVKEIRLKEREANETKASA